MFRFKENMFQFKENHVSKSEFGKLKPFVYKVFVKCL